MNSRSWLVAATAVLALSACTPRVAPRPPASQPVRTAEPGWKPTSLRQAEAPRRTREHPGLFPPTPAPVASVPEVPLPLEPLEPLDEFTSEEPAPLEPAVEESDVTGEPEPPPAPSWATESLAGQIASAASPNVAAALRLVERGRELLDAGDREGALDPLERAVSIDPTNAFGYYFLARLYFERHSHNQAMGFANRAAILVDGSDAAWAGRTFALQGTILEAVARYGEARAAYGRALDVDPRNVTARVGLNRLGATREAGAP